MFISHKDNANTEMEDLYAKLQSVIDLLIDLQRPFFRAANQVLTD